MHDGQEDAEQIIDTSSRPVREQQHLLQDAELSIDQLHRMEETTRRAMERKRQSEMQEVDQKRARIEPFAQNFAVIFTDNLAAMNEMEEAEEEMDESDLAECMDY